MRDVEHHFVKASECRIEVPGMLEAKNFSSVPFPERRTEWKKTRNKPKEILPYGTLFTRLFKHVVFVYPELAFDHYISHDRAMHPLAPHYEQKTRSDHGKKDLVSKILAPPPPPPLKIILPYLFHLMSLVMKMMMCHFTPTLLLLLKISLLHSMLSLEFYVIKPNDYVSVNSIIESKDVIFDEERFTSIPRPRGMIQPSSSKIDKDEVEGIDDVPGLFGPRKTNRTRKAKSFGQKERIDLFDTYAPVARISTIRLLLALAAIQDLVIHQIDVITAFLNGDLDEEIYMKQPEGFVMPRHESKLEYFRAIGCLMYAMISTRPDIAFAIEKLSSIDKKPTAAAGATKATSVGHQDFVGAWGGDVWLGDFEFESESSQDFYPFRRNRRKYRRVQASKKKPTAAAGATK
nr:zinc finger, CCHC-type [Tanacetum cinerariifolium]